MQRFARSCASRALSAATVALLLTAGTAAQANVLITGTRVIYPAGQREITVRLDNAGTVPALVQAWVDSNDSGRSPSKADAPFLLTPPIFRIDPDKGQSLRLMFTGATLPTDRESVFWLNVMDIPPTPKDATQSYLQLAIHSHLKLFYRPKTLPGSPEQAAQQLRWQLVSHDSQQWLRASNNSGFHVSLGYAAIQLNGREYRTAGGMVAPFSSKELALEALTAIPVPPQSVSYESINDYGALQPHQSVLQP